MTTRAPQKVHVDVHFGSEQWIPTAVRTDEAGPHPVVLRIHFSDLEQTFEIAGKVETSTKGGVVYHDLVVEPDALRGPLADLVREMEAHRESQPTGTPCRVLLIEDNPQISEMFVYGVRRYFQERGVPAVIDPVADVPSAWRLLQQEKYDLVMSDYYLPGMDGATFISRLRQDPKLADLPVVAISAGGKDVQAAVIDAGANLFLHKPIVLRDLFATLDQLLQRLPRS
jgi:CheY-like chemotaxis protein